MANALAAEPFGLRVTIRREMGRDVAGACGQLALKRTGGEGGVEGDALVPGDVSSATRVRSAEYKDLSGSRRGAAEPAAHGEKTDRADRGRGRGGAAPIVVDARARPVRRARRSTLDDAPAMDAVGNRERVRERERSRARTFASDAA